MNFHCGNNTNIYCISHIILFAFWYVNYKIQVQKKSLNLNLKKKHSGKPTELSMRGSK